MVRVVSGKVLLIIMLLSIESLLQARHYLGTSYSNEQSLSALG